MIMPSWTKEQMQAIETSGTNIIVSAGAGSGKTAVLTERVIRKIKSGININELLILTFTNAAAHEMKERIRSSLKKEGYKEQLSFIDQAYITTFDSFALSIVKKYHYLLNIPKNVNIIDGTFIARQKEIILDGIFEKLYRNKNELFLKLIDDFCVKDDKQIRECILTLYSKLSQKEDINGYLNNYIDNYYNLNFINERFNNYEKLVKSKIETIKQYLEDISYEVDGDYYSKLEEVLRPLFNADSFDNIKCSLPNRLPILKESTELGKEIKSKISSLLKEISKLCEENKDNLISEYINTKDYIKIIIDIILELNKKVLEYKNSINYYEFGDIALMAINILKNNSDIRLEMKNTYKEIMIDEYQDTNDLQEYFVSLIENNNVYMVGDIKQSIYRFRNANPNLFKSKYDNYKDLNGGLKIDLNKNFRSRREILEDINVLFELFMDNSIGGAEYRESHRMVFGNTLYETDGLNNQNNNLEIYNYEFNPLNRLTREETEAFIVAEDIKKKINDGYLVFDKDSKILRKCQFSDFVILMDRTTCFDTFKKVLDYYEIPVSVLKDDNIINEDEIKILKNYIKLVLRIYDGNFDQVFRYCFTSVSRSYLYNMSDNEIYECFKDNKFYETAIFKDAKELSFDLDNISVSDLLIKIVDKICFFNKVITTKNISNRVSVLDYLKNTIKDMNLIGLNIYEICDYLDEIVDNLKEIKVSKKMDDSNAVKIMTIFKSKGLEFSICYQTGMLKQFNIRELNSLFFYDNDLGIVPTNYNDGINDTFFKEVAKNNYMKENISERIRLFYVSLTRSKEKMIILADLNKKDTAFVKTLVSDDERLQYKSFNDILLSIKENIKNYITDIDLNKMNLSLEYRNMKDKNIDLFKNGNKINIHPVNIKNKEISNLHFSKETHELVSTESKNNMEYGTFMHEVLESIDFYNSNLDEYTIDDTIKQNIYSLLSHDVFKNLHNAKIYKEYEFIYNEDDVKYHGIIDLMIVRDNYIDIVDYKLKNIDDLKYIDQLNGYKKFVEKLLKKPVNLYLYSIMENKFKSI